MKLITLSTKQRNQNKNRKWKLIDRISPCCALATLVRTDPHCLSIHATYCVIIAGASQGEIKMWAAVRENGDFLHLRFEYLGNCWRYMGTCCETICKHWIPFPSIQHLAWLPQGRPKGKQNVVKIAIFGLTHWLKHRITRKLLKIDRYYVARGLASIELSFHPYNTLRDSRRGVSRGNKNVGCGT